MEITVRVSPELAAEAQAQGVPLETYVEALLALRGESRALGTEGRRAPEEVHAWVESLAQFSDQIPPLPDTISREWIYQDHD